MDKKTILSVLKRIRIPLLVIGLISAGCSPIVLKIASDKELEASQIRQDAIMAVRGELMPFEVNMSKDFVIDLGNCQMIQSAQALAQGIDVVNAINFGSSWPFLIGFKDNKMSISANITNSNNETVAYIENNNWKSLSPTSIQIGDRNYNDYAFEVVDISMVPIFNVRVVGANEIQIGGLFNVGSWKVLISDNGGGIMTEPSQQNITDLLTPIFKYPSDKYLGELINPTYLSSLPTDTSDKILSESSVLTIVGYVLAFVGVFFIAIFGADTFINFKDKESQENRQKPENKQSPDYNHSTRRRRAKENKRKSRSR